jgi:hydantoinase/carbamoylase family amidase
MKYLHINSDRLWSELMALAEIGADAAGGVTRVALSEADQQAQRHLVARMGAVGLDVRVDAAFNVIGTLAARRPITHKKAAIGSHLDTVPGGGRFDGALGVACGLECARTIRERGIDLPWDLEVISFCDEEGGHHAGTVGSRAMVGRLHPDEIHQTGPGGRPSFAESFKRAGGDPQRIAEAHRPANDFAFFLEVHIEQGRILESEETDVGVVTAIAGIERAEVTVTGEPAHSGTTPMHMRNDSLVAAAPVFTLLPRWTAAQNPEMVGTIGRVSLWPGAVNVVPGKCRFVVELRSRSAGDMRAVWDRLQAYAAGKSGWRIEPIYRKPPALLSEWIQDHIRRAARKEGLSVRSLPSGAGHDAASFAPSVPTGMIFVPCRGGVSHQPAESIDRRQAANGCQVLLRTLLLLADAFR